MNTFDYNRHTIPFAFEPQYPSIKWECINPEYVSDYLNLVESTYTKYLFNNGDFKQTHELYLCNTVVLASAWHNIPVLTIVYKTNNLIKISRAIRLKAILDRQNKI